MFGNTADPGPGDPSDRSSDSGSDSGPGSLERGRRGNDVDDLLQLLRLQEEQALSCGDGSTGGGPSGSRAGCGGTARGRPSAPGSIGDDGSEDFRDVERYAQQSVLRGSSTGRGGGGACGSGRDSSRQPQPWHAGRGDSAGSEGSSDAGDCGISVQCDSSAAVPSSPSNSSLQVRRGLQSLTAEPGRQDAAGRNDGTSSS